MQQPCSLLGLLAHFHKVLSSVCLFGGAALVHCWCAVQVAASVEDQLAAARASIDRINAEREQQERDVDKLQDAFRQMLAFRWGWGRQGLGCLVETHQVWVWGFGLARLSDVLPCPAEKVVVHLLHLVARLRLSACVCADGRDACAACLPACLAACLLQGAAEVEGAAGGA